MQNIGDRLFYYYDSFSKRLNQGWPTRSSLIHGLKYQDILTSLTFPGRKLNDQKLNFRD